MKLSVGRQKLLAALKSIQVVVPNHVVIPASSGFLFEIEHGNFLKISCTDAMHSASCVVEVDQTDGGFKLLIPAHRILAALSLCSGDQIVMSNKQWTGRVDVTDGHVLFKLATISAEMPSLNLDFTDRNCVCTVDEGWLLKSMSGVEFAAAKTDARGPVSGLSCVCIQTQKGEVSVVAGSGVSIAKCVSGGGVAESKNSVPLSSMKIVKGLLHQRESECSVYRVENRLVFKTKDVLFSTPLVATPFPEVSTFFSRIADAAGTTTVSTDEILTCLNSVMVLDDDMSSIPTTVTIESVAEELRLSAETTAGAYAGIIAAKREGQTSKVAVQCMKLIRGCSMCGPSLTLHMSMPSSPVYVVSDGFTMVIMPVSTSK